MTKKATCAEAGERTFICAVCGETKTDPIEKDRNEHAGGTEIRNVAPATCGKDGYTGDTYCKGCGEKLSEGERAPATGEHTWDGGAVTKSATCAEPGETTFTCEVCAATKTETIEKILFI